jgi:hypothetical protein
MKCHMVDGDIGAATVDSEGLGTRVSVVSVIQVSVGTVGRSTEDLAVGRS